MIVRKDYQLILLLLLVEKPRPANSVTIGFQVCQLTFKKFAHQRSEMLMQSARALWRVHISFDKNQICHTKIGETAIHRHVEGAVFQAPEFQPFFKAYHFGNK